MTSRIGVESTSYNAGENIVAIFNFVNGKVTNWSEVSVYVRNEDGGVEILTAEYPEGGEHFNGESEFKRTLSVMTAAGQVINVSATTTNVVNVCNLH